MKIYKNFYLLLIAILFQVFNSGCSGVGGVSPEYSGYKTVLFNQMQDMIDMLFGGHNKEFMATYVSPDYIQSMGGVDQALLQFGNDKQQFTMSSLRIARNITPFYDPSKKTMSYVSAVLVKPMAFKLVNGKWYMTGDWFK